MSSARADKPGNSKQTKIQTMIQKLIPILILILCVALLPEAPAISPAPDGCYPNFTTAEGCKALNSLTAGAGNTAVGWYSLFGNSTGSFNTAVGAGALDLNTADNNTAVGVAALLLNTTGTGNTANGVDALVFNNTGSLNTANGAFALFSNTTAVNNTATGYAALYSNTTGTENTAIGVQALYFNTNGGNTATGAFALKNNSTGGDNTANGANALTNNTIGESNTAFGATALFNNTTGVNNTADGHGALFQNTTGSNNIALGISAGDNLTIGDANIDIGNEGVANDSETTRIGTFQNACFIAGIRGTITGQMNAIPVLIDSLGQLGTQSSSKRFKKEIKPMDQASEAILALKPVTFHYKSDKTNTPQFGLIAEEVADVNPGLVVRDEKGEIYTVRYDQVNAMLLNEFLKEHKKVQDLESRLAQQEHQIECLSEGLQKVNAQLEMSRPAPQVVAND